MALTPSGQRFPDWIRLRRKKEFDLVFRGGRKCVRRFLVVHTLARQANPGEEAPTRLGMAISRKVGPAVVRNKVRRRLREIFRRLHGDLQPGFDLVVTGRSGAGTATYQQLESDLAKCLEQHGILRRAPSSSSPEEFAGD